ncbi:hypothetical protein JQC91_10040 [Jannaschia sp. Os4]|uniref:hypothetical protein n=1 Tax=Jannaschia sp. Os4 TaxID=2807617 RepID=UPI00193A95D9|nr:hypothetical protein [Jannaschia sp. Os4]MBM2576644.1 hypothetical protein [Jannaschia sp. Os4]
MTPIQHIPADAAAIRTLLASPLMAHAPVPTATGFAARPAAPARPAADCFDFAF